MTRIYDWIWLEPYNGERPIYVFARRTKGGWAGWQYGQDREMSPIVDYLEGLWKICERPLNASEPVEYD